MHVALELRAEELRRHHQAVLAVPRGQRPVGGIVLEGAARVLVEADDESDVVRAGLERAHRGDERGAAGRAAVLDVHEREPRRAEIGDHRVRVARVLAAAVRELHVGPRDAGVGERGAHGVHAHRQPAHAFVPPERMDPGADDRDLGAIAHGFPASASGTIRRSANRHSSSPGPLATRSR